MLIVFFAGYLVVKRDVLALARSRVMGIDLPRGRDLGPILVAWAASLARARLPARPRNLTALLRAVRRDALHRHRAPFLDLHRGLPVHSGRLRRLPALRPRAAARRHLAQPVRRRVRRRLPDRTEPVRLRQRRCSRRRPRSGSPRLRALCQDRLHHGRVRRGAGPHRRHGTARSLRDHHRTRDANGGCLSRLVRQAARCWPLDRCGHPGVRRRRRRHEADPPDRPHHSLPVLRWVVPRRELGARRPAPPGQRRRAPPTGRHPS